MEVTDNRAIGKGVSVSVRLTDGEIQQIAERLVELLPRHVSGERLIDAAEVARRLGISRSTVYEKAEELGAVRIGQGRRARLRFDPQRVVTQLAARSGAPVSPALGARRPAATRRRKRRALDGAGLLPIRGGALR
jgi:excisionase family DNA binding protein